MSIYAKIENDIIVNIIDCDDENISTQNGYYIKVTSSTRNPQIGGTYNSDSQKFIDNKPYQSWTLNENFEWESPVEKTTIKSFWDEDSQSWKPTVSEQ